jgi:O-acetyl-ADP-ribose deacetylase (regulator of RNase III)
MEGDIMPISIQFGDITEFNGDAIINSLGINGAAYGRLCRNILEKCANKDVIEFINSKTHSDIGQIYITDAGKLNCRKILHIVTPFRHMDDNKKTKLHEAYKSIVDECIKQGFKNVAIPFIGTGANGYKDEDAYSAVDSAMLYLVNREEKENKELLNLSLIIFDKRKKISQTDEIEMHREKKLYNIRHTNINNKKTYYKDSSIVKGLVECCTSFANINIEDLFVPEFEKKYKTPIDYIDDYIDCKGLKDLDVYSGQFWSKQQRYVLRTNTFKNLKRIDMFRLIYSSGMNFTEAVQFMTLCGHSFSPVNKLDCFFLDYLKGRLGKITNIAQLGIAALNYGVEENLVGDL